MFFYPSNIFHFHSFDCHLGSQLESLWQKCNPDRCDQNSHKSRLCFFTQQTFSISILLTVTWGPSSGPRCKSVILTSAIKIHIKVVYVFHPTNISHFHSFGCHLVSHLGSLRQKCDPDRCDQNSHKSCSCFFIQQTFPTFISLAVTWGPNLDPCCKSVILTGAIKLRMKITYVFFPNRHFPFSFRLLSLGVPTWFVAAKVRSWQMRLKLI